MKIRLIQLNVLPGFPANNAEKMLRFIEQAKQDKINIIVFPEMAISGYLLGDEWERSAFLRECEFFGHKIRAAAQDITVIFGNVAMDWQQKNEDGRERKYNAVFAAEGGEFLQHPVTQQPFFIKMLMPNYREFDDSRHFYDPRKLAYHHQLPIDDLICPVDSQWGKLGCILCEDGWDDDYNLSPLAVLKEKKIELIINISSSPYTFNKNHKRNRVFSAQAKNLNVPLLYVNNTGLQDNGKTVFAFDGASCAYDRDGSVIAEVAPFIEGHLDVDVGKPPGTTSRFFHKEDTIAEQFEAIQYGTQRFLQRIGVKKVVVGVSGGIDSALVASLYRRILPPDDLLLVSMPGPFTSSTTLNLARELATNLGCRLAEIPITPSIDVTKSQLSAAEFSRRGDAPLKLEISDFVLENIQARDRSSRILAGVAAAFGGVFTCNANKSEMTVGYGTLYGDLGGFLASIADLWKGEVYLMARFINESIYGGEAIPQGTLDIVPSAELSAKQNVDAGQGDPLFYPYHDALFRSWVERWQRATPEENLDWYLQGTLNQELGYEGDLKQLFPTTEQFITDLEHWWTLYQGMAVAKRIQAPPVLAVKRRAFGFDHREAQLGARLSTRYHELKSSILVH